MIRGTKFQSKRAGKRLVKPHRVRQLFVLFRLRSRRASTCLQFPHNEHTSAGVLWRIQMNVWQKTTKSYIISEKGKEKLRDVPYLKVVCLLTLSWLCLDSKLFLTCRFSSTCWSSFTLFCLHLIGLFSLLFWSFLLTLWFDLFFDWPDVARRGRTCLSRGDFGGTRWGSYLLGCARQKRQRLWRMPV